MTIAISIKVNDGIVLASDSATTIIGREPAGGTAIVNIYENANKIFNLKKGLPIGAITWGSGSIGPESISTLAKDFRKEVLGEGNNDCSPMSYTIEEISNKFRGFICKKYDDTFREWSTKPSLGFMVVGYSTNRPLAEEWRIDIINGQCNGPNMVRPENATGLTWNGEIETITRLFLGFSTGLEHILRDAQLDEPKIHEILKSCRNRLRAPMVIPAMPIQDAIDLAVFLVETTIKFSKFSPGAPTVGGPIEVAAITKHEGFKWVKRKHYFNESMNPKG
jgi:hypothetical protein